MKKVFIWDIWDHQVHLNKADAALFLNVSFRVKRNKMIIKNIIK